MRGLSIRAKVLLVVSLSLIGIFAIITWLLVAQNTKQLRSSLNSQSKSFASLASKPIGDTFVLYKDSGSIKITEQVNNFLDLNPDVKSIDVVTVNGDLLYKSAGTMNDAVDSQLAAAFTPQYVTNSEGYIVTIVQPYFEDSGAHRYSIVYEISTGRIESSINDVVRLIVYAGIVVLVLSITITGLMLNLFFIRPLRSVSRSANIISSGNFNHDIKSDRHDEIGNLAASVNKMADFLKADIVKLKELDKLKSEFMMITSHNLRTPITIMEGYLEMAESAKTAKEMKDILETIQESVVRLHLLSESVLTISTLESGNLKLATSPTLASEFIQKLNSEFELLGKRKKLAWKFTNDIPDGVEIEASQAHLRSALGNVLDNAIKFSKEGAAVSVHGYSSPDKKSIIFEVKDEGIGISAAELPKLFTKFHRATSTLSYNYEGLGLGLYLTKIIVEQHGGKIEVNSQEGIGSTFVVYLPIAATLETSS